MALTYSNMVELGTTAPEFQLAIANPGVGPGEGDLRSLSDYAASNLLVVVFMCNHCPYVKTIEDRLISVANDYLDKGVQFVGICSNDPDDYEEDNFENLGRRAIEKAYPFPYLQDLAQDVARAYKAECTPDFFVYDQARALQYRGRLDEGRPGVDDVSEHDLRTALDQLLATGVATLEQIPAMGCSIKWRQQ